VVFRKLNAINPFFALKLNFLGSNVDKCEFFPYVCV